MYCQSCGAQNTDEAKFCNQCGTRIAKAGDAGGPLSAGSTVKDADGPKPAAGPQNDPGGTQVGGAAPPAATPPRPNAYHPDTGFGGPSMMSVSLASIGVKSSKKVWVGIVILAVALVALGWLGSWLARGEPEVVAEAGHAEPDDPFVIGTPLPEGEEPPEVDIVSGSEGDPSGAAMSATGTMSTGTTMSGGTTRPSTMTSMTTMTSTMTSTMATMTSTMSTGTSGTSGTSGTMEPDPPETMETMETTMESTSMTSTMGTVPDEGPEERDLEMELYSSRVRYVIRRYYANRAQACFDRATRNAPTVSGTVVVSMTIGADGAVSRSRTTRNTTGDDNLGQCLQAQVSTWRLPPPPGGSLDMQMPFSR